MFVSQIFDEVLDILGTTDKSKGLKKLTQAVQTLMQSGHYFHTNAEADICTGWDGMTITLPRGIEVPLGVNVDGSPTYFRGRLFQYHVNKGGMYNPVGWAWDDRGMVATQMDIRQPSQLVAVAEHEADAGKVIRVIGTDSNNREMRSQTIGGTGVDGVLVPIHAMSDFPYGTIAPDGVTITTRSARVYPFIDLFSQIAHQLTSGVQMVLTFTGTIPNGLVDKQKYYVGSVSDNLLASTTIRLYNTEIDAKNGTNPIRMQSVLNSDGITLTDSRPIDMYTSIELQDGLPLVAIDQANEVTFARRGGTSFISAQALTLGTTGTSVTSIVLGYEDGTVSLNVMPTAVTIAAGETLQTLVGKLIISINSTTGTTGVSATDSSNIFSDTAFGITASPQYAVTSATFTVTSGGPTFRYLVSESALLPNPLKENTAYFVNQMDSGTVSSVNLQVYASLNDAQHDINQITLTGSSGDFDTFIRKEIVPQTKLTFTADPGYATGDTVQANTNGGTLPQPLIAAQNYYVSVLDETPAAVTLHTTYADAIAGINPISLTTAGTGQNSIARLLPATAASGTRNNISVANLNLPSASGTGAVVVPQISGPLTTMTVGLTGGGYSSATATLTDVGGYKYTSAPTVLLQNGSYTVPAVLSANIATDPATSVGYVSSVVVVSGGQGYDLSNPPTVVFSGGLASGGVVPNATVNVTKGIATGAYTSTTLGQNISIYQPLIFTDTVVGGSGAVGYIGSMVNGTMQTTTPITPTGITITAGTVASNVATITFSTAHGLRIGDSITLTGFTPSGWNTTLFVTSIPTTTSITASTLLISGLTNMTAYGSYTYANATNYTIVSSGAGYSAPRIAGVLLNPNGVTVNSVAASTTLSSIKVFASGASAGTELLASPIVGLSTTVTTAVPAIVAQINSNTAASKNYAVAAGGNLAFYIVSCPTLTILSVGNAGSQISTIPYTTMVTTGAGSGSFTASADMLAANPYTLLSTDTTPTILATSLAAWITLKAAGQGISAVSTGSTIIIKPAYNVFIATLAMTTNGGTTYYSTTTPSITNTTITVTSGQIVLTGAVVTPTFRSITPTGVISGVNLLPYGSGATASVSVNSISKAINGVSITQTGAGYLYPPRVTISPPNQISPQIQVISAGAVGATVTYLYATLSDTTQSISLITTTAISVVSGDSVSSVALKFVTAINALTNPASPATPTGYSAALLATSSDTFIVYAPAGKTITGFTITTAGTAPAVQTQQSVPSQATASATITTSFVTGYKVASSGSGYTTAPAVNLSGGNGTGASATAVIDKYGIGKINVVSGGAGYPTGLLCAITDTNGGTGTGASANVVVSSGVIVSVNMTNFGRGYSHPAISFIDPNGGTLPTGANAAVCTVEYTGVLTNVNVVTEGTGYTAAPTVTITPSTGVFVSFTSTGTLPSPIIQGATYRAENPSSGSSFTLKNNDFSDVNLTSTGSGNLYLVLSRSFSIGFTGLWTGNFSGIQKIPIRLQSDYQLPVTTPATDDVTSYYVVTQSDTSAIIYKDYAETIQIFPTQLGVGQAYFAVTSRSSGVVYNNWFRPNTLQYLTSDMYVKFSSLDGVLPAPLSALSFYYLGIDGPNATLYSSVAPYPQIEFTTLGHGNVSMDIVREFVAAVQTDFSAENSIFETGDAVTVRPSAGDALPYPLLQSTLASPHTYYVGRPEQNYFSLYTTRDAAIIGNQIAAVLIGTTGNTVDSYFYVDLIKPPTLVKTIQHVEKPETVGYVSLYAFDYGRSNDMALIGQYHPSETNPKYRRIRIGKPCAWARVIYRVKSPDFTSEYDYIPLESPRAIIAAVHAIDLEDKDFLEQSQKYWQTAIAYLKNENESMDGHAMQPPQINNETFGDGTDPIMF